jgi:osmotically-inducible protein OsmY
MLLMLSFIGCASTQTREGTGEYIDDSVITTKVKTAVAEDVSLKSAGEIHVETFKGIVRLSGSVNSQADVDKAVELAGKVGGVKSVTNELKLK